MKLLIATGLYPPDIGGPATYTVFLEHHLKGRDIGLTVVPFTTFRKYPPVIRHLLYLKTLILKSRGCGMIYALDTVSVGVPALFASLITQKPLILRVPGDYAWEQGQQRFGITETLDEYRRHRDHPLPVRILAWLQRSVARHALHVIVPSEYMKGVVEGWGVEPRKVTRMYSELQPFETPQSSKDTDDGFVVTTAARLVPWKGVAALIEAVVELRRQGLPIVLKIIGDGVMRRALEEQITKYEAGEYISLLGALPRTMLGKEIARSHVFVLNTSYEGLSHQLLEVMSLRVPIVTTPVGGNVEIITHEETGLMVPFNDVRMLSEAIKRIYEHPELGAQLASRAEATLTTFQGEAIVEEFVSCIKSLWKYSH